MNITVLMQDFTMVLRLQASHLTMMIYVLVTTTALVTIIQTKKIIILQAVTVSEMRVIVKPISTVTKTLMQMM